MAPPTNATPGPVAWLATLQQRFLEGRDCDVVVRVTIEQPPAKRARADENESAGGNGAGHQEQEEDQQKRQQRTVDIPCQSAILNARSAYFDAALSGAFAENEKKVEIVLADALAVEDFRLLIKLSCGASYVQEGDVRLPVAIRLRLAFLANAFEFVDCVQECLQSLSEEELWMLSVCSTRCRRSCGSRKLPWLSGRS